MPIHAAERDLTIRTPWGMFNHRIGFLVFQDGKVLLHKSDAGYWFAPGGRVAFGENSTEALAREIDEELHAKADHHALAAIIENFFSIDGTPFHEVAFFYRVFFEKPVDPPGRDRAGKPMHGAWFTEEELKGLDVRPSFLTARLFSFQDGFQHIMHGDGKNGT